MNDLERELRDTLLRHEDDAPTFEMPEARRAAGRAHRRQVRNVVVGGIICAAAAIVGISAFGGLMRADRPPTVLDQPSPPPTTVAPPGPAYEDYRDRWPGRTRNPAGIYAWDASPVPEFPHETTGFMHNGYKPGSGDVSILFEGTPGRLVHHRGDTAVTIAGHEGTYRRFLGKKGTGWMEGLPTEEWMVDIDGTTVTVLVIADRGSRDSELAEAHDIIESIRVEPQNNDLGFRLTFTLPTNTWDSG